MARAGEIRENPGGRRLLLLNSMLEGGPKGELWSCLQLNGRWPGEKFGCPEMYLNEWKLLATLPPDPLDPLA
jgi:hypothetical protein